MRSGSQAGVGEFKFSLWQSPAVLCPSPGQKENHYCWAPTEPKTLGDNDFPSHSGSHASEGPERLGTRADSVQIQPFSESPKCQLPMPKCAV